jgi:hypothetical protein
MRLIELADQAHHVSANHAACATLYMTIKEKTDSSSKSALHFTSGAQHHEQGTFGRLAETRRRLSVVCRRGTLSASRVFRIHAVAARRIQPARRQRQALFAEDDPYGWRVPEIEEEYELRPGLAQIAKYWAISCGSDEANKIIASSGTIGGWLRESLLVA